MCPASCLAIFKIEPLGLTKASVLLAKPRVCGSDKNCGKVGLTVSFLGNNPKLIFLFLNVCFKWLPTSLTSVIPTSDVSKWRAYILSTKLRNSLWMFALYFSYTSLILADWIVISLSTSISCVGPIFLLPLPPFCSKVWTLYILFLNAAIKMYDKSETCCILDISKPASCIIFCTWSLDNKDVRTVNDLIACRKVSSSWLWRTWTLLAYLVYASCIIFSAVEVRTAPGSIAI